MKVRQAASFDVTVRDGTRVVVVLTDRKGRAFASLDLDPLESRRAWYRLRDCSDVVFNNRAAALSEAQRRGEDPGDA